MRLRVEEIPVSPRRRNRVFTYSNNRYPLFLNKIGGMLRRFPAVLHRTIDREEYPRLIEAVSEYVRISSTVVKSPQICELAPSCPHQVSSFPQMRKLIYYEWAVFFLESRFYAFLMKRDRFRRKHSGRKTDAKNGMSKPILYGQSPPNIKPAHRPGDLPPITLGGVTK